VGYSPSPSVSLFNFHPISSAFLNHPVIRRCTVLILTPSLNNDLEKMRSSAVDGDKLLHDSNALPPEKSRGIHWTGGSVDPRANLNMVRN
jgi:hypothetical protein